MIIANIFSDNWRITYPLGYIESVSQLKYFNQIDPIRTLNPFFTMNYIYNIAFLLENMKINSDEKNENISDNEKPVVSSGQNIAIIIGTILFPVIGVAMGYTFYKKDNQAAKKAGRNWLILGIIMFIVNISVVSIMK